MDVVTANKGPIAWNWSRVAKRARAAGRLIRFEGTVMDGLPVFSLLEYTLPDCSLTGFEAVFNSTTNSIIEAWPTGASFDEALAAAQAGGYAEADPNNDVDGWDAAYKAAALANVAMDAGITPADIERQSLRDVPLERILAARAGGRRLRLVTTVWRESGAGGRSGRERRRRRPGACAAACGRPSSTSIIPWRRSTASPWASSCTPISWETSWCRDARPAAPDRVRRLRRHAARARSQSVTVGGEAVPRRRFAARALLIAALVPLAGAAVGLAAFRVEQVGAAWRPAVTRATAGWRVDGNPGEVFSNPALSGDYVAWDAGPFTLLADLRTGTVKLIGAARDAASNWPPAISDRFVTWVEATDAAGHGLTLYVYDLRTHRRTRVKDAGAVAWPPALSGTTAYWVRTGTAGGQAGTTGNQAGTTGSQQTLVGEDLATGRRFSVGPWAGVGDFVVSGKLAAWVSETQSAAGIVVMDLAGGRRWQVPLEAFQAARCSRRSRCRRARSSGASPSSRRTRPRSWVSASRPAIASSSPAGRTSAPRPSTAIWSCGPPGTRPAGMTSIMGVRLSGGSPFVVPHARPRRRRPVSGDTVPWVTRGGAGALPPRDDDGAPVTLESSEAMKAPPITSRRRRSHSGGSVATGRRRWALWAGRP